MKSLDKIPTSKVERAAGFIKTGAKVGVNYVKYYGNSLTKGKKVASKALHEDNAKDIYDGLKSLKGSALKVAQMMSMDQGILPEEYVEQFSLAQFSVPPLSGPLVKKTFRGVFGKSPEELFDQFDYQAMNAASIGQVHLAEKDGKKYAVKIQYPGVKESISSDLAIVKPFAMKILGMDSKSTEVYFNEVKNKLIEETDYQNELVQGISIADDCSRLDNVIFPAYHKEFSADRILAMDYMEGLHLSEYLQHEKSLEKKQEIAQSMWDFFMFQIHELKKVHADPHPGNFKINKNNQLVALDFGCMKAIPEDFYLPYFELTKNSLRNDDKLFKKALFALEILKEGDSEETEQYLVSTFRELLSVFTRPFQNENFNFKDHQFKSDIEVLGNKMMSEQKKLKQEANRGSKHFIYINRTFFGLYNIMMDLEASNVIVNNYKKYL